MEGADIMFKRNAKDKKSKISKGISGFQMAFMKKHEKQSKKKPPKKISEKKVLFFHSIKTKLYFAFLIPILFIIILGAASYTKSSKGIYNTFVSTTKTSMSLTGDYLEIVLNTMINKAIQLDADIGLKEYFSGVYKDDPAGESKAYSNASQRVSIFAKADDFVQNVSVFADYGKGISSNGSLPENIYDEFSRSKEGRKFIASGKESTFIANHPSIDGLTGENQDNYCLSMVYNLRNVTNRANGFIVVDLKTKCAEDVLTKNHLGEGSINGFVIGNDKQVIVGEIEEEFLFADQDYFKEASESTELSGSQYVTYQGEQYLFVYTKVHNSVITLCSLIPKSTIVRQAEEVKWLTIAIVLVACLIAIIVGTLIASGISRVIRNTNIALGKAADGDLTVQIKTKRKDEFLILSGGIANMISSMKNIIRNMSGVSDNLSISSGEVTENSEILLNATKDISNAVNDIEQGLVQQASHAESCLTQMAGLSGQISAVYESTTQIESIAKGTQEIIGEGIVIVDNLNKKAKDTSDITHDIIVDIENLEKESRDISSIIETINDISSQTNLLSLNASIEAARAGAAGRGFAVVADEIRKLADQSSTAAKQIGSIIEQIQSRTKNTVVTAKKAEDIVNSQGEALKSTISAFGNINEHVAGLAKNLQQISDGMSQIERAKEDTLSSIESISSTSEETKACSSALIKTTDNQLMAVESLNKAAVRLKEDAGNLENTVNIFTIN